MEFIQKIKSTNGNKLYKIKHKCVLLFKLNFNIKSDNLPFLSYSSSGSHSGFIHSSPHNFDSLYFPVSSVLRVVGFPVSSAFLWIQELLIVQPVQPFISC